MRRIFLVAILALLTACGTGAVTVAPVPRDDAFINDVQQRTFRWFWELTNPQNGLTPDRAPTKSFSSVAAVGFALTAYPVGVERGWVSRDQARDRTLTTLRFFWNAPQGAQATGVTGYKGFFYHFLDMETGLRFKTVELSTIDSSLLLGGILFCREYFDRADSSEVQIRALADSIYFRVDWPWAQARAPAVSMGWHPETGFIAANWNGYNEGMIVYILALASPTHPIQPSAWNEWTGTYTWGTWYGQTHVAFAPLFGHQYSHVWIDFRRIQDEYMRGKGIDYFENSRRATLAQRSYAIDNPSGFTGYGANIWGLTAADGPHDTTLTIAGRQRLFFTYSARGTALNETRDDGTIAPTAAGGSVPFAPEITLPALRAIRDSHGGAFYNQYGFVDAFNLTWPASVAPREGGVVPGIGWVDTDQLGIDQGPIIAMIENYRSDLIWKYMRRSPYIRRGLERAGFTGGWLGQ